MKNRFAKIISEWKEPQAAEKISILCGVGCLIAAMPFLIRAGWALGGSW